MLSPRRRGRVGHMWGIPVFDHQLHPYPGDFDYHFGPELGQFEWNQMSIYYNLGHIK